MYEVKKIAVILGQHSEVVYQYSEALKNNGYDIEVVPTFQGQETHNLINSSTLLVIADADYFFEKFSQHYDISNSTIPILFLLDDQSEFDKKACIYSNGILGCIVNTININELFLKVKSFLFHHQPVRSANPYHALINHSDDLNTDTVLVKNTCRYLKHNIHEKLMLDEVAHSMGSNRSKLSSTFKRVLGKGVFEWLREHRMLKAKSLLINSKMTVQQVGFEVGYENCANFSTAYKREFHLSPSQQRKAS